MDAADWMLNFVYRGWLYNKPEAPQESSPQDKRAVSAGIAAIHSGLGVLRRSDARTSELMAILHAINPPRPHRPYRLGFVADIFADPPRLPSSIKPVETWQLYWWEGQLPANVRSAGRVVSEAPFLVLPAVRGRLDHTFKEQNLRRFVTINIAQPEEVVAHDVVAFLRAEKKALEQFGGPYIEALRLAEKRYAPKLATLANLRVLPYLDLVHWSASEGVRWTDYALANHLLQIDRKDLKRTKEYAELAMFDLALRAWLGPLVRGVPARSKRPRK